MFHEIDQDKIDRVRGMDITVVTTAKNDDEGRALLKALGFPFKTAENPVTSVGSHCSVTGYRASVRAHHHHRSSSV